jgi:hypothetical protein
LEEQVKSLEERTFEKKKSSSYTSIRDYYYFSWGGEKIEPITLEQEIMILQDKIDVLAKLLKVKLVESEAKEKEWIAKKIK